MSDQRVIETLEAHGCSWKDYILFGEPPHVCICRWSACSGLSALLIEDDALANEAREYLRANGARHFASMDDLKRESGWDGIARVERDT